MAHLPAAARALFDGDPATFVHRRNVLAAELKAAGDRDVAAMVAALRRPTAAAAALNRLRRERPELIDAVLDAAGELARAQRRALSGIRDDSLRRCTRAHGAAATAAVDALAPGVSATAREDARRTLLAAALDAEVAATLREGTLSAAATGADDPVTALGAVTPLTTVDAPARPAPQEDADVSVGGEEEEDARLRTVRAAALAAAAAARAAHRTAQSTVTDAARRADVARRGRDRAAEAAADARRAQDRAGSAVSEAERALATARSRLDEAVRDATANAGAADRAEADLDAARSAHAHAVEEAEQALAELEAAEAAVELLREEA